MLVGKLIKSIEGDQTSFVLSIVSIVFTAPKLASLLGPLLLQHVVEYASDQSWASVHICCPTKGQYGEFVRQLIASDTSWSRTPGKVVVRISDVSVLGPYCRDLRKQLSARKICSLDRWPYDSMIWNCGRIVLPFRRLISLVCPGISNLTIGNLLL